MIEIIEGGTHNAWAPSFDFLSRVFLPQLAKAGPRVSTELESYGFYPAGGGNFRMQISPCSELQGFELTQRLDKPQPRVTAIVSNIPASVGERECSTIRRKTNWREDCCDVIEVERPTGPGNVVMIELVSPQVTELFTGFGKLGLKAEHVARGVLREARSYLARAVPVGEHLADQLLLPMGIAASQGQKSAFRTGPLSMHRQHTSRCYTRFSTSAFGLQKRTNAITPP